MKYEHLLSLVKVGNLVLKSRMIASNALPHFLQGPETFPSESVINHVVTLARNGAAIVTFADWTDLAQRQSFNEDGKRFPMYALDADPSVENYFCQMTDQIHFFNSYASIALNTVAAPDPIYDVNDEPAADLSNVMMAKFGQRDYRTGSGMMATRRKGKPGRQLSPDQIHEIVEQYAQRVKKYQSLGFDMATLHCAYRAGLLGRFLSPVTNHRTDAYGGVIENRARILLELCAKIKELCGADFPIEVQFSPVEEGGTTLEETSRLAKAAEGLIDIFQFRADTGNLNHPTGYNSKKHIYLPLEACARVKAAGTSILCGAIGGFQNPEDMEEAIAGGQADLIAGARLFIADFEYYEKLKRGEGDRVVPCIRCNKCHVPSLQGEWLSYCSVNPRMGIEHRLTKLTRPAEGSHKVAVVGGGPAGMRAALMAAERGYDVTLFEATNSLGGQLKLMDAASFKWPLVEYRKWLVRQVEATGVKIFLNTRVDKEILEAGRFDVVILALGAEPKISPIPGAERAYNIFSVFGNEEKMGKRCVVIGGSESGTEAALYLAENGHQVTILTRGDTLAPDATPIHYRETIDEFYQSMGDRISYKTHAVTVEIGENSVTYRDANGELHTIECDDVVALGGMRARSDEALTMFGLTPDTYMIGDCRKVGNLHECNRSAYAVISNL